MSAYEEQFMEPEDSTEKQVDNVQESEGTPQAGYGGFLVIGFGRSFPRCGMPWDLPPCVGLRGCGVYVPLIVEPPKNAADDSSTPEQEE